METKITKETLQNDILRIIGAVQMSKEARSHFLRIIGVMFGREHPDYKLFENLTYDEHIQTEMLKSGEGYKYRQQFQVFCHIVLTDFIKQVKKESASEQREGPKDNIPKKDILLEHYFTEMEKASQHRTRLVEINKEQFAELKKLEYSLLRRILPHNDGGDPITETEFSAGNYRQLLTVWFMYTQFIFYPEEIQKVIELCKIGKIKV